jgi:cation:H+ antiporter
MQIVDFAALALPVNVAIFTGAASVVWFGGVKLTGYAKTICDRTGAQQAFIGVLLLGAIVSLPEMATTIAAATLGHARLAVNILLGGIAAAMVILAVTDALTGDEPLSSDISHPVVVLQGILVVLFLAIAASGIVVGDAPLAGVGMWTSALLAFYVLFILLAKRYGTRETWTARDRSTAHAGRLEPAPTKAHGSERSIAQISFLVMLAAVAILGSGFVLAGTGEALAQQTGLGASFIGMLLGGVATSLPEVSTTVSAVRLGQYEMAFADAFGTNLFSVMLLFVADLAYNGGPILNEVDRFSLFATLLGILLTSVYLAGFVERRRKSILWMGIDSVVVLIAYAGGLVILFFLR